MLWQKYSLASFCQDQCSIPLRVTFVLARSTQGLSNAILPASLGFSRTYCVITPDRPTPGYVHGNDYQRFPKDDGKRKCSMMRSVVEHRKAQSPNRMHQLPENFLMTD